MDEILVFLSINNQPRLYTTLQKSTAQLNAPKKSTPVREWTYNNLKSDVLAGRFAPGERLTEEHLANGLGVSRTPVREALHKLASEGLIQPLESRGFCVGRCFARVNGYCYRCIMGQIYMGCFLELGCKTEYGCSSNVDLWWVFLNSKCDFRS